MSIRVLSFCTNTWTHEAEDIRAEGVSLLDHLRVRLEDRLQDVSAQLKTALENDPKTYQATFFTLPEFFWNTGWQNVKTESDIRELCTFYLDNMTGYINRLVSSFPTASYPSAGEIIFLAGTCAALYHDEEAKNLWGVDENTYRPVNWLLSASNKRTDISVWPKRHTSHIDFFSQLTPCPGDSPWFIATLAGQKERIRIAKHSEAIASSMKGAAISDRFINVLPEITEFSVDICLDYATISTEQPAKWQDRVAELERSTSQIDFLISCGMTLESSQWHPASLRYLVRNDGGTPECQVYSFSHGWLTATKVSHNIMHFELI